MSTIKTIHQKLSAGFFGFWVRRWRVTVVVIFLLIGLGLMSLRGLPKESFPQINFGVIAINTVYIGASAQDIDELITKEIYDSISSIDGIDKIESSSRTSVSSLTVTLEQGVETQQVLNDLKTEIDKVNLPTDAQDPTIIDVEVDTDMMFTLYVYAPHDQTDRESLITLAQKIEYDLEGTSIIEKITIQGADTYDIRVLVDQTKAEQLGLTTSTIAQTIRGYVTNTPLGNYEIQQSDYDFRIDKSLINERELLTIPLQTARGTVLLGSLARVDRYIDEDVERSYGSYQQTGYTFVGLTFSKNPSAISLQSAAEESKKIIADYMQQYEEQGIAYDFGQDSAVSIKQSYDSVTRNGLITLILVFISVFIFVSLKESIIATLSLPLAFFITFFVFQMMGSTLNFMTNFSMIVTFGIAIDTIIVILEGASEKRKMGYSPYSAALLALHEFKAPLIAATATTCVVFIPLFTLPGTLGKFLSYIPITIFVTLIGALIVSLLINPTLYYLFNKSSTTYTKSSEETYLSDDEKILLAHEREGKEEKAHTAQSRRDKLFGSLMRGYERLLHRMIYAARGWRWLYCILPIVLLVLSFRLPIKTIQFPASDADTITISITGPAGSSTSALRPYMSQVDGIFSAYPEVANYTTTASANTLSVAIELLRSQERKNQGLRDSFALTDVMLEDMKSLEQYGLTIDVQADTGGPQGGKPVAIDITAQNAQYLTQLQQVANDFEQFMSQQPGLIEITNSNQSTPGQFVFRYQMDVLQQLGLTPGQVSAQIISTLNGREAGTIASDYDDHTIRVMVADLIDTVTPVQLQDIQLTTPQGVVRFGELVEYDTQTNSSSIRRKDGSLIVTIGADTAAGYVANDVEPDVQAFADSYEFPRGISYALAGENAENASVNTALGIGVMVALFMIFIILVLQFNSFRMPLFIFYSIIMALMGANIGLFVTGNPRSLAFNIGFISLMGIVVNDAIVFIDRINTNIRRGMDRRQAIIEAGVSRLQPILLTTISTIVGLSTIVREDEFFAGLGYTIIFGLFVGSLMTLVAIPVIYSLFVGEKRVEKMRG